MSCALGLTQSRIVADPPVFRRRRDSDDTQDDVIFYVKDQSNTRQV